MHTFLHGTVALKPPRCAVTPQHGFWGDVTAVAQALERLHTPAKINYLIFGHRYPHLHCHLLVHGYDADPHKPVDMNEQEVFLEHEDYHTFVNELRAAIFQK